MRAAAPSSESFQGLVLEGVTRRFGGVGAVKDVSFSVGPGEIVGLIGPNGAGKSTLLSLISGNQKPSAGRITFRGHRLDRMPAHAVARLGVGRAHQSPRPFRRMTVLDNARVAAHAGSGRRVVEHDAHGREVLDHQHDRDVGHRRPVDPSSGRSSGRWSSSACRKDPYDDDDNDPRTHWSILPRLAVKAEVLVGIFALLPAMLGRAKTPQAQEALGEIIRYLTTLRAFVRAAEDQGRLSTSGYWMPDPTFVSAGRAYSVEHYRRIIGYLHELGTQSLVNMPTEAMLDNPVVGPTLERMLAGPNSSARDRAQVTRLAIDLAADSFGGRQTLFELFNALPWTQQRELLTMRFDVEPYKQLALATAGVGDLAAAGQVMAAVTAGTGSIDYHAVGEAYLKRHHDGAATTPKPA